MDALQDDVNKLLESRQKALEHCTSYHNKRNKLDSDLQNVGTRLNEVESDAQKPLTQKIKTLKVSRLFVERGSSSAVAEYNLAVYEKNLCVIFVAFWVTNPCRFTRKVKQTKMYVCTLEDFILVDIWIHCCASWKVDMHWKCCSLYTIATIEEKCENCS